MSLDKQSVEMPLVAAMLNYKNENVYPLHTPGHKGGRGMERLLRQEMGDSILMDVSLMSELDDIHEPESYIKEGQALAAHAYGSDACFWCVNGLTGAIYAPKASVTAIGARCQILRFLDVTFRLVNIVQLAH